MNRQILTRALILGLSLTTVTSMAHAAGHASYPVDSFEAYEQALDGCAELNAGDMCSIAFTESFVIPSSGEGFYGGEANLILTAHRGVVISGDGGTNQRLLTMDGGDTDATLLVTNLTVKGLTSRLHDQGGVFELESVAVAMFESVHLVSNHAAAGGAMVVRDSTVIIRDSHFEANIAAFSGGALHVDDASDVSIARTVFLDNITSGSGGAIGSQYGSDVRMASSVLAGNVANNGNAISLHDTSLALTFVTLAGSPMGAAISMPDEGFDVTMSTSVVAPDVTLTTCDSGDTVLASGGLNFLPSADCLQPHATDVLGSDPRLLRPVPGTGHVIPGSSSPVRDAVPTACVGLLDVRAMERPQGTACDAGAYELADTEFPDVTLAHPFVAEVTWLAASGVTGGYGDGTFRPSVTVSRQAMAAFLYRIAGSPEFEPPATASLSDVPVTHPFFAEIEWLVAQGVTTGYGDGTFRPSAGVSRQAMAAFLFRFSGAEATEPETASFSDVPPSHPFFAEVEWLAEVGVSTGYSDGTFRPGASVSRMAMAAFLARSPAPLA